ncbi:MAG: Na+/H+ antiporter subunit E [Gammaproteobacteria bacterium]|nr:Na+/H+ antiporter subunit E [Gammaproteobacteria bacterium]
MHTSHAQHHDDETISLPHYFFIYAVLFLFWLLLVGNLRLQEMAAGALVALAVTLAAGPHLSIFSGLRLEAAAPFHLLRYFGYFWAALIRANLDVARRVLSPSLPIRPALVEVRTELKSNLGRLMLANSITLTPGTLSVDLRGDHILVHWIDCPPGTDLEAATREIAAGFEQHLRGFLK